MKVANRGISGDTTRGVLIRLEEDVLSLKPKAIVLLIGTNDLEEQADPETITANLKLLLAEFQKHNPKMPIILNQVFPSSDTKKRPADKIKKINELYLAAIKGNPQVTLVETWPLFANAAGDAKKEEFPDLLHPNKEGYAKWATALRPVLAVKGLLEEKADTFTLEPGFVSLFNGKDLTGWGYRTNNFDGKTVSMDGRYSAQNGVLVVNYQDPADLDHATVPERFHLETGIPRRCERGQRHFHPPAAAPVPRLPHRRPLQRPETIQATGLERDHRHRDERRGPLHL
jgi:hypothetical protein